MLKLPSQHNPNSRLLDFKRINQIPVARVAEQIGLEVHDDGRIVCPRPDRHEDGKMAFLTVLPGNKVKCVACGNEPMTVVEFLTNIGDFSSPLDAVQCFRSDISAAVVQQPNIVDDLARFIERFVFLKNATLYRFVALWIIGTYLTEAFEYFGYLFAHSAEPQSGKSRLLEVCALLTHNSTAPMVSPSEAVLFRTGAGATQLLDEVDAWTNKDQLSSVLNAGFRNGGSVPRMKKEADGNYLPQHFPVYGARALAGIGTDILNVSTRDRTFMFRMERQTKQERREKLTRNTRKESEALRKRVADWVKENASQVAAHYESGNFPYLEDFSDRTIDVSQSLAAILEIAYKDNDRMEEMRAGLIEAIAVSRQEVHSPTEDHALLAELLRIAERDSPVIGTATELGERCSESSNMSASQIARVLQKYGFKTKSLRLKGSRDPKYRYVLTRETLAEIVNRYAFKSYSKTL